MAPIAPGLSSMFPNPIGVLMLDDLRRAALYLEVLPDLDARQHAIHLWAAAQAVERMLVAIEQLMVSERSRRTWTGGQGDGR